MTSNDIIQIFFGGIGSLGFGILFNIRGKKLLFATLGGFASWFLFVILGFLIESEPVRYFIVASFVSIFAEIMARVLKTPTTTFHMTALVPLIPGGALYYTMAAMFEKKTDLFLTKGVYTLELAVALALGIVLTTAAAKIFYLVVAKIKNKGIAKN